jgi:integrase
MLYKQKGAKTWMLKFKHHNEVIRFSTKETNRRAAEQAADDIKRDYINGIKEKERAAEKLGCTVDLVAACPECGNLLRTDRAMDAVDGAKMCGDKCRETWNRRCRPIPLLKDFLTNNFLPHCETHGLDYSYGVKRLLASDLADVRLDEITKEHASQLAASLRPLSRTRPLSPSAINAVLRTLRHALNCAVDFGKLPAVPKLKKILLKENKRERVVTDAEFAAYLAACGQPWHDIALLVRHEGLRPWDEAAALRWENIKDGLICIAEGKTDYARRQLPIAAEVFPMLEARYEGQSKPREGWVFPANTASGHTEQGSGKNQHLKALKACKGMTRFAPYCLRHTFLTGLAARGVDAFTIQRIAWHSHISVTERYVHPQRDIIARAFFPGSTKGSRKGSSQRKPGLRLLKAGAA